MPIAERLAALRAALATEGLAGFIVPLTDEHMSEYVAPYACRLAWLSGFTGSAGTAVVLGDKAALFVDGRYTIQAAAEVDQGWFTLIDYPATTPAMWLKGVAGEIGYDPWLTTIAWIDDARAKGVTLRAVGQNPIDQIWTDRPPMPDAPAVPQPIEFSGRDHAAKLDDIAKGLVEAGADWVALTALDSIAWAFNIRGRDIAHTPVALAFALVGRDGRAQLFLDRHKIGPGLIDHLGDRVTLLPRSAFVPALKALGKGKATLIADPKRSVSAVFDHAAGATILKERDPCVLPKACKNEAEIAGMRAAHVRDGAALCEFLAWFAKTAPQGGLSEIAAADRLEQARIPREHFQDLSFRTISAAGPHAAIPHYSVTTKSNRIIEPDSVYLVDSGGQYQDGTTDVTRTIAVGKVDDRVKRHFTHVLKGHIALSRCRFPKGTPGQALDAIARAPLWRIGCDYDHGTGHGVGAYLGVHEGPQTIAKLGSAEPLQPGMVLSNEPGYYQAGAYGIRIENLLLVVEAKASGDERPMLGFEPLTLAPIDRAMIAAELLDAEERAWLNHYHRQVRDMVVSLVNVETRDWLIAATMPLQP